MTSDRILHRIVEDLNRRGAHFALIGGLAVSVRTEPRFTKDVDLAVAVPDDAAAEALVLALRSLGYFVDTVIEQEAAGRLATVRLIAREGNIPVNVDLLFASSGIEREIVEQATPEDLPPNFQVPVARSGHLCALKLLANSENRPHDAQDLLALKKSMTEDEWQLARTAVALIVSRGYNRERDLERALAELRSRG